MCRTDARYLPRDTGGDHAPQEAVDIRTDGDVVKGWERTFGHKRRHVVWLFQTAVRLGEDLMCGILGESVQVPVELYQFETTPVVRLNPVVPCLPSASRVTLLFAGHCRVWQPGDVSATSTALSYRPS